MPCERYPPDDPREWLRRAREDLALARATVPGVGFEPLCYHAQQAAEKAIKGVLLKRGVTFPYVHDLGRLLDLLREAGHTVPRQVEEVVGLTAYAVITRYPYAGEVSESEYRKAVDRADAVLRWAEDEIASLGRSP